VNIVGLDFSVDDEAEVHANSTRESNEELKDALKKGLVKEKRRKQYTHWESDAGIDINLNL
jgi:hypothetical protein